ncbi:MAG: hypothetical protein IKE94_11290 [Aeriscardovia sp.]|nr:hypothetical protein [Aeriscardovia sp.]
MAVLVPNVGMPESCAKCPLMYEDEIFGKVYPCVCHARGFIIKPSEIDMRDGLCPLVEVPDKEE